MTHFIIKLVGASIAISKRRGDFIFLKEHNALVYQGREIPIAEHNAVVPKVLERYKDYMPRLPQVVLLPAPLVPVKEKPASESQPVETETPADGVADPALVEPTPASDGSDGVSIEEETDVPPTDTPAPETEPVVEAPAEEETPPSDTVVTTPVPDPAPPTDTPAPPAPKKKGGRPPKYGPGGTVKS